MLAWLCGWKGEGAATPGKKFGLIRSELTITGKAAS